MSSERFTKSPEYRATQRLLDIVRRATCYRLYRARDSRYTSNLSPLFYLVSPAELPKVVVRMQVTPTPPLTCFHLPKHRMRCTGLPQITTESSD